MKKLAKGYIALLVIAAILCAVPQAGAAPADEQQTVTEKNEQAQTSGFEKVLENDKFSLSISPETANIALTNKKTGIPVYATPVNADSDVLADGDNRSILKSQLIVYYYEDNVLNSVNSWSDCISHNGMSYTVKKEKLYVTYQIGDNSFSAALLPNVLTKKRMENDILAHLSEKEQKRVLKYFKYYDRSSMDKDALKSAKLTFPSIEKTDLYVRSTLPEYIAEEIYKLFQKAGYSDDDLQKDCDENGIKNEYKPKPSFNVTLEYAITNDGMKLEVNPSNIEYKDDYKPVRISLLPFFGARSTDEDGYIIVPDGCGSVINFNNGKTAASGYWKKFYNSDGAVEKLQTSAKEPFSVLPFFALSGSEVGFLATVDSGSEVGGISADISGKNNSYNSVNAFFDLCSADVVSLSGNKMDNFLMTSEMISLPVSVSYHFTDGNTDYSSFARTYRQLLQDDKLLGKESSTDTTATNIDLIGSALVSKRFLGIPYQTIDSLTTYAQAVKIINEFGKLPNQVNYINALQGGYYQKSIGNMKPLSVLGSKKALRELKEITDGVSFACYAQRAAKVSKNERVKSVNHNDAHFYYYNPISRYRESDDVYYLLSAQRLTDYASKLIGSMKKSEIDAVNFLDIGYELNSDFNEKSSINRMYAADNIREFLKSVKESADITVDVGSVFSFAYADKIRNVPTQDSGYAIEDYAVPFYQIVVSGIIPYTVESLNTATDSQNQFLKAVETGAQLQYLWIYEQADNIVRYREKYFGLEYKDSVQQANEYAEAYQPLYKKIAGSAIKEHSIESQGIRKTVFENGVTVYVNYSETEASIGELTIPAENFMYTEESKK